MRKQLSEKSTMACNKSMINPVSIESTLVAFIVLAFGIVSSVIILTFEFVKISARKIIRKRKVFVVK